MNLSDRVWKLTDQFKSEMELALELGLGDGKSAAALSRDVRQYLNEPHRLFRRVRDEKGQLRLSKAAAAYHPGQGVYRSSYKNALRLTATENNMAYRTADHERWNDLDFVIGMEIKLSGNHPIEDICDEMCGVYPKTFKFVGWHPFCRCYAVPKLADEDEFIARQQALIDGEELPQGTYTGEVTEMPECFTQWVQQNAERIETAKAQPYFIQDNRTAVDKALRSNFEQKSNLIETKQDETSNIRLQKPPHVEEYKSYDNGNIRVSPLHGVDELESNLRLGKVLHEALNETVYLLPNINPQGKDAHFRTEYLPEGVKKDKNPDFLCAGRLWDGKECSFENTKKEWKYIKNTLENHFKKAKEQADNFIIEVPDWLNEDTYKSITLNYLNISKKDRWIIICNRSGKYQLFKYTTGQ